MFVLSPGDNRVNDRHSSSSPTDGRFGGNRKVSDNTQKAEDYTKPSKTRRANLSGEAEKKVFNPVGETTDDIDDMNDPNARKRETSRRAETSTVGAQNKYRRPGASKDIKSDADKRPRQDGREDEHVEPDGKHGSRNVWRIGEDRDRPGDQNLGPDQTPR